MAGRNMKGPREEGPLTGRGLGRCGSGRAIDPDDRNDPAPGRGMGRGFGRGWGAGNGNGGGVGSRGRGQGRRAGRGAGPGMGRGRTGGRGATPLGAHSHDNEELLALRAEVAALRRLVTADRHDTEENT